MNIKIIYYFRKLKKQQENSENEWRGNYSNIHLKTISICNCVLKYLSYYPDWLSFKSFLMLKLVGWKLPLTHKGKYLKWIFSEVERDWIIICIFIFLMFLTEIEAYGACVTDYIYDIVLFLEGQKTLVC